MNRNGTIQVHERFEGGLSSGWEPAEWDEYLRAAPGEFLDRLERASGLTRTATRAAVGAGDTHLSRACSRSASTAVKSVHGIEIQPGYIDTSGYGGGPNEILETFRAIPDDLRRTQDGDLFGEPGYRFWIVMRNDVPILAFEQDKGLAWTQHHPDATDLLGLRAIAPAYNLPIVTLELLRRADKL